MKITICHAFIFAAAATKKKEEVTISAFSRSFGKNSIGYMLKMSAEIGFKLVY